MCLAAGFTTLVDTAVLTVAAPSLRSALHAGPGQVQWILASYSLTFAVALVPAGRLGDRFGRRRLFLAGMSVFALGALAAATAATPGAPIAARLLQGLGGGTVNPQTIGLLQDHFEGPARARALGAYAAVGGAAAAVGPAVGALVILGLGGTGWRVALLACVPSGVLTLTLAARTLPAGRRPGAGGRRPRLDVAGLALVAAATLAAVVAVTPSGRPFPTAAWWTAVVVLVGALVAWERWYARRGGDPILDPALVRSPRFVLGTVVAMLHFGVAVSASVLLSLVLQTGAHTSALAVALATLPSAAGMILASSWSWRALQRGGRHAVTLALACWTASIATDLAIVGLAPQRHWVVLLSLSHLAASLFAGLTISPNQALSLATAPARAAGLAAGILQVSQRIASAVCLSAFTGLFLGAHPDAGPDATRSGYLAAVRVAVAVGAVAVAASALDGFLRSRRRDGDAPRPAVRSAHAGPDPADARPRRRTAGRPGARSAR